MKKYKGMTPRYHTHSTRASMLAVEDHSKGIYNTRKEEWRIGEQQEYARVWRKLDDGYAIIFTDAT